MADYYSRQKTYKSTENGGKDNIRVYVNADTGNVEITIMSGDVNVTRTIGENDRVILRKQLDAFVPETMTVEGIEITDDESFVKALMHCNKDEAWELINKWFAIKKLQPDHATET